MKEMKIVNLIHIGDEVKDLDAMTPEEKQEIAMALNRQALEAVGYKEVRTSEGTA